MICDIPTMGGSKLKPNSLYLFIKYTNQTGANQIESLFSLQFIGFSIFFSFSSHTKYKEKKGLKKEITRVLYTKIFLKLVLVHIRMFLSSTNAKVLKILRNSYYLT